MKTPWVGRRHALALLALVTAVAAGAAWWLLAAEQGTLRQARRVGPPALVQWGGPRTLWLLTRQEEYRSGGRGRSYTLHHFDLHGHDVATTKRLWSRRLLTVHSGHGGSVAEGRILGQQGPVVWVFLHNQPVALSHADGSVQGGKLAILERNPGLAPMWPEKLQSFAFDKTLIVTTADALHWQIDGQTLAASSHQPPDPEAFKRLQYMSGTWNGSYKTGDFLTRHQSTIDDRWIGLFSEREAADAAQDGFGSNFKDPSRVFDEGPSARRGFWLATIGKTRAFSEGRHDRLMALTPVPGSPVFLQGGLMRAAQSRDALEPGADGGAIVLHRTRIDEQGLLSVTRVTPALKPRWTTVLPIGELLNRWQLETRLLMLGSRTQVEDGVSRQSELLLSLDLEDGKLQQFDLQGGSAD